MSEAPAPTSPQPPAADAGAENRGFLIAIAYLGPLAFVPLLIDSADREVRWHARHGLVLLGGWIAVCVVVEVLARAASLGYLAMFVYPFVGLAAVALHLICMLQGLRGKRVLLPRISRLADLF